MFQLYTFEQLLGLLNDAFENRQWDIARQVTDEIKTRCSFEQWGH